MAERIKFLMDEHIHPTVTRGLRERGIEVLTVQDVNLCHTDDTVILDFARMHGYVVFTQDADFLDWHEQGILHAGIAYIHQQTPLGVIIRGLVLVHDVLTPAEIHGRVEFL